MRRNSKNIATFSFYAIKAPPHPPPVRVYFMWNATLGRILGNFTHTPGPPPHWFLRGENELSPLIGALAIRIHSCALISSESRSNPAFVCRDIQKCHHAVLLDASSCLCQASPPLP